MESGLTVTKAILNTVGMGDIEGIYLLFWDIFFSNGIKEPKYSHGINSHGFMQIF